MNRILEGRRIVIGITAGIAAYKTIDVISQLRKRGAEVKVVMTKNATHICTPLTVRELSHNPVSIDMWETPSHWSIEHIALADWAEVYAVIPCTANVIGKIANGIADDMLTTSIMATTAPKLLAPAMNTHMYENPIVQENMEKLSRLGYQILTPATGLLACGVEGIGRLPEVDLIVEWITRTLLVNTTLEGKRVLISAGGTQEAIDPVRFIGNHSSGKMGYAMAEEARLRGAKVTLVTTPTHLSVPAGVHAISVTSAMELKEVMEREYNDADYVVMAAAVSDYRVENPQTHKIKKQEQMTLSLIKNPDILKGLGEKKTHQVLVGFAAETNQVISYAKQKLKDKHLDYIVANDVGLPGQGFHVDTNAVTVIDKNEKEYPIAKDSKKKIAQKIWDILVFHV